MSKKASGKKKSQPRTRSKASRKGKENTVKGRIAEEITARMYDAPLRNVERNAALPPVNRDSKLTRDIDVLLSSPIVSRRSERSAIECKNLDEKVDVEKIDAFVGKLQDVGIPYDHGIYVSTSGYTKDALDRAKPAGIKLLKLTGLTEDRLKSLESPVSQFSVFYLAQVTGFTVTNNVSVVTKSEELMTFYDETDKSRGTVLDLIWNAWQEEEPKSEAGEHKLSLKPPAGWHQIIDGKSVPVLGVTATVHVWALALKFTGTSTDHSLIDVAEGKVEKRRINASFDIPRDEKTVHSLNTFRTEAELKTFIGEPQGAKLTIRTRLPRIQCMDAFFYPFSRRVAALLSEHMKDYKEGGADDLPALKLSEVEGSDLRAMWEPLDEGYPGKIIPVIITDEKGDAAIDVTAWLWAKEYKKVIALRERLERKPNPALAELIHDAYIGQGELLLSEAEKRSGAESRRLLNRAKVQLEEAVRIKPHSAAALNNLGYIYKELGRYEEALRCFDYALALEQDSFITWVNRAKVLTELERIEEAEASYGRALTLQPADVEVIFYRSVLRAHLGRFEESVAGFDEVLKAMPDHARTLYYRGLGLMRLSRFDEAETSFERALSLDPSNRDAYVQQAFSLIQNKELDRAIEALNTVVSLAPPTRNITSR
jgi:tetratricopeptide (TPR) repeat protein